MRVTVLQENLAHGLSVVSRAVSPRSTLPVLANVLVATDEGRLRLSATNLELGITCWIGAKIIEEGSTTVPARTFNDLIATLPSDQVEMSLNVRNQKLNVRCGSSNTDINCIDSQEFPPMPTPDLTDGVELNVTALKEMIQQVAFAASTDEARPVLTGILLTATGNQITLQAADGFRLSIRKAELSSSLPHPIKAIIPARALAELLASPVMASPWSPWCCPPTAVRSSSTRRMSSWSPSSSKVLTQTWSRSFPALTRPARSFPPPPS